MSKESNNQVELVGTVSSKPILSHKIYEEDFYTFVLSVNRLSNTADQILITVAEHILKNADIILGDTILINGQFRSYNNYSGAGNKLLLTVFVKSIEKKHQDDMHANTICINGYVCKEPIFRVTPFGREITDLLIAVNRTYHKSDYIPCIAWGQNAKNAASLIVGTNVTIEGRVQSRNYQKKISEDEVVTKTAFEISVSKITETTDDVIELI